MSAASAPPANDPDSGAAPDMLMRAILRYLPQTAFVAITSSEWFDFLSSCAIGGLVPFPSLETAALGVT